VLAGIGTDPDQGLLWVAADGRFGAGVARGRGEKDRVQHLGQTAREAERQRRIAQSRVALQEAQTQLAQLNDALARVETDARAARIQAAALPEDHPLREALIDLRTASNRLAQDRDEFTQVDQRRAKRVQEETQARVVLHDQAAALGLASYVDDPEALDTLHLRVNDYANALKRIRTELESHHDARVNAQHLQAAARRGADRAQAAGDEAQAQQALAVDAEARHQTLESTSGQSARDVQARLLRAQENHAAISQTLKQAVITINQATADAATAEARRAQAAIDRDENDDRRAKEIEGLRAFIAEGFLETADPDLTGELADRVSETLDETGVWSPTRGVEVARRIDGAFVKDAMDDETRQKRTDELHQSFRHFQDALDPKGYGTARETWGGDRVYRVTARFRNQPEPVARVVDLLDQEIVHRAELLDAQEKKIIENHLIDEVADTLHRLIHAARRQVADMNHELAGKTTATGMELRFKWESDDAEHDALRDALKLLQIAPAQHGPDQRRDLASFLQTRIQAARDVDDTRDWETSLADALDHRRWHSFYVERRAAPGDPWKRLNKKTYGTGSGGEKALALTIPQFAAASAHYRSARPDAPRLIMLDEAFAGVDAGNRAICMSLLCAFDLDVVMTSDREPGCYAAVPGNAIYHLSTRPGVDAVLATRYVWNGTTQTRPPDHGPTHGEPVLAADADSGPGLFEGDDP